jgi:hypothetical protein
MNWLNSRLKKYTFLGLIALMCCAFMPLSALCDVSVYAEGSYDEDDLVLYIYADITDNPILSYGVKINYPVGTFTNPVAEKNEAVWFFGDGDTNHPYMDPETGVAGEVVIIGGKLDTSTATSPMDGVIGGRVLLGKVTFTHSGVTDFSGVSLTLGRDDGEGGYENFVGTAGQLYDALVADFSVEIRKRGDANGDGFITSADMFTVRGNIGADYTVWSDCNVDGFVTSADMFCVRSKL